MDASTKGRSTERPPSPQAPRSARRARRGRVAVGATVAALGLAAALGPAAADVLSPEASAPNAVAIRSERPAFSYPATRSADERAASARAEVVQQAEEAVQQYLHDAVVMARVEDSRKFHAYVDWVHAQREAAARQAEEARQAPASSPAAAPSTSGGGRWDALARCEAGGNWAQHRQRLLRRPPVQPGHLAGPRRLGPAQPGQPQRPDRGGRAGAGLAGLGGLALLRPPPRAALTPADDQEVPGTK